MAEDKDGDAGTTKEPSSTEAVTKLLERLGKIVAGDAAKEKPKVGDEPAVAKEPASAAERARAKYDAAVRWIVGVFAAVGMLIFGSVPFADLNGADWDRVSLGLGIAGAGLALVLWATTRGLEPEDASLGELNNTLEQTRIYRWGPGKKPANVQVASWKRWRPLDSISPRRRSMRQLKRILIGPERSAHLGPKIKELAKLIEQIGECETEVFNREAAVASNVHLRTLVDQEIAVVEAALTKLRSELDPLVKEAGQKRPTFAIAQIQKQLARYEERHLALMGRRLELSPDNDLRELAEARSHLDIYLQHRSLLLLESIVAQLRGTFRQVRLLLLAGGLATLVGGLIYASGLQEEPDKEQSPAPKSSTSSLSWGWGGAASSGLEVTGTELTTQGRALCKRTPAS